jgi:hypothetical protein
MMQMPSLTWIRNDANSIANGFDGHPTVKKLAKLVEDLCTECEKIQQQAEHAERRAKSAERDARR